MYLVKSLAKLFAAKDEADVFFCSLTCIVKRKVSYMKIINNRSDNS